MSTIPDYPVAPTPLDGTEAVPVWQGGAQKQTPVQAIVDRAAAATETFKDEAAASASAAASSAATLSSTVDKQGAPALAIVADDAGVGAAILADQDGDVCDPRGRKLINLMGGRSTGLMERWRATGADYAGLLADQAYYAADEPVFDSRIVCGWNEDANTSFARQGQLVCTDPVGPTYGFTAFFTQRNVTNNDGEQGQRLVYRTLTATPTTGGFTKSATTVIEQPSGTNNNWTAGQGNATGPAAIRHSTGVTILLHARLVSSDGHYGTTGDYFDTICRLSTNGFNAGGAGTTIFHGPDLYTTLGVTPPASDLGFFWGSANTMVEIPAGLPNAGRVIAAVYLNDGSGNNWQGTIYTDDVGVTWHLGQFFRNTSLALLLNEHTLIRGNDGIFRLHGRNENGASDSPLYQLTARGRSRFKSATGISGWDAGAFLAEPNIGNVVNCACVPFSSPFDGNPAMVVIGGSTAPTASYRDFHRFFLSYDHGDRFIAEAQIYEDAERPGYGPLLFVDGWFFHLHDISNGRNPPTNFNSQPSQRFAWWNMPHLMENTSIIGSASWL